LCIKEKNNKKERKRENKKRRKKRKREKKIQIKKRCQERVLRRVSLKECNHGEHNNEEERLCVFDDCHHLQHL
jgi:hypothetical protein